MFGRTVKEPTRLNFDELLNLKFRVDAEINKRHGKELESLKTKLTMIATTLGITIAEMFGLKSEAPSTPEKKHTKKQPKLAYRDPENAENTWSGKGRVPKWLQEKLDQGATKDQFQIQ